MSKPQGVYPICPTPFLENGALDLDGFRKMVDYLGQVGVSGLAIMGFMGEVAQLTAAERRTILQTAQAVRGNLGLWVGVRAYGTMGCIEQAQLAADYGADMVFVAPIEVQNDDALYDHYRQVAEAISIPVMLHDYPPSFRTILSAELIAKLGTEQVAPYIKLEDTPVGPKLSRIRELAGDAVGIFGGLGGIYYLEELERGALGIATGFSFPEVLVEIYNLYSAGNHAGARAAFDRYASILRYEFQPKLGLPLRKYAYQRRGIFSTTVTRAPAMKLDAQTIAEFERTLARVGLSFE